MKFLAVLFACICACNHLAGQQNVYYLKSASDSFTYSEEGYTVKLPLRNDSSGFGTSLYRNALKIATDIDSIVINYNERLRPEKQQYFVNISGAGKHKVVKLIFWEANCWFSENYIHASENSVRYDIPEVYELANVLYTLTTSSLKNPVRTFKSTPYYKEMQAYFAPFKKHPLIRQLEFADDVQGAIDYYNFRDNSFCFKIEDKQIVPGSQYYSVWGEKDSTIFQRLLPLINDFYRKSGFRKFYSSHKNYYDSVKMQQEVYMPALKMKTWLERQFPERYNSYVIIFSPLIWGSHGTQNYNWVTAPGKWFHEAVMFVCGPGRFINQRDLTPGQRIGIASGIVFTEIDHNYINPISNRYRKQIDSALMKREAWVVRGKDADGYATAMSVFNEYLTHAMYLLYAYDSYNEEDFKVIRKDREHLMVEERGYYRFADFVDALLKMYKTRKADQPASAMFPEIINWFGLQ